MSSGPAVPIPRGATWDGHGVNFALFSAQAEAVELCLFDRRGRECQRIMLREQTDHVWHCYLPQARPGLVYGYRVHGPYQPQDGLRFNAHKLLIDPYARDFVGRLRWNDALYGYTVGHRKADLSFDRRDSAAYMPKCRVLESAFSWGDDRRPDVPWHEMVIYEMHVKGYTMRHPRVPEPLRGTYAGLSTAAAIDHLRRLGVTTVELMPVHAFLNDRHLAERQLQNYWGYNTLGFFAPEPRYASAQAVQEFKTMVRTLHAAGIEVILDVVYNHSCEGNQLGPDAVAARAGQRRLLRAGRRPPLLHRRHRLRQHAEHRAPARAAAGDGLAALLGRGDACRRLPLRPGLGAGARARPASTSSAASSTPCARTRRSTPSS